MKIKIFTILAVLLVFACPASAVVGIDSVDVVPSQPLDTDSITFDIFGGASRSGSWIDHEQFSQNGTSLQLDLYIDTGEGQAISEWTYSKLIQPLSPATYSLEVRAFDYDLGTLQDTYTVDFTVTPEPATIFLLGCGIILAGKKLFQ